MTNPPASTLDGATAADLLAAAVEDAVLTLTVEAGAYRDLLRAALTQLHNERREHEATQRRYGAALEELRDMRARLDRGRVAYANLRRATRRTAA